jgi:hypothetical protein
MTARAYESPSLINRTVALRQDVSPELGNIPAQVIRVWPRFQSGNYLVTLEYATPTRYRNHLIRHIDAFLSDLVEVPATTSGCTNAQCADCRLKRRAA